MAQNFVADIAELRRRAREHIENGAVTEGYQGNRDTILKLLGEALATEMVCVLRYQAHAHRAVGLQSEPVKREFQEHAKEEQEHADLIAGRITQLGGAPDLNPATLAQRSHSEYSSGDGSLIGLIKEDLVAERIAIDSYAAMIRYIGESDSTTRRMLEEILAKEEEHADDLSEMLATLDPRRAPRQPQG